MVVRGKLFLSLFALVLVVGLSSCKLFETVVPIIVTHEGSDYALFEPIHFQAGNIPLAPLAEVEFEWDFGDDLHIDGEQITHQFTEPGLHIVTLFVIFKNRAAAASAGLSGQHGSGPIDSEVWEFTEQILIPHPAIDMAIDSFDRGISANTTCPGSGGSPVNALGSEMLFGSSRMEITTSLTGSGELLRTFSGTGFWFSMTGDCSGEVTIRYPETGSGTAVDLSSYSVLAFPVEYQEGAAAVDVTLSDGTNQHTESAMIDENMEHGIYFDLSQYAAHGVNLSAVNELHIVIDGSAPLDFTVGGANGFGN